MFKSIVTITVIITTLLISCGKPNIPEDYTGGYRIINKIATYGRANDVIVDGNYAYVTQGEGGLAIFDISNPNNVTLKANQSSGLKGYSTKLIKKQNMLYIAAGGSGFNIVNVADLDNIQVRDQDVNGRLVDIHLMGDFLINALSETGVLIANVESDDYIDYRGTTHTDGFARGIATTNDHKKMFIATGEMGLSLYDISFFDDGYGVYPLLGHINLPGYAESVVLDETNQVAFVACGSAGLQIVDYSDVSNLKIIGNYDCAGTVKNLIFDNSKIYLTANGLQIYDVSTASDPKLVGIVDMQHALGLSLDEDNIYVADKEEGLIVVAKK